MFSCLKEEEEGMWPKLLRCCLAKEEKKKEKMSKGKLSRNHLDDMHNSINVNEEYMEAFRTKSYTEIWNKIQGQRRTTIEERLSISPLPTNLHDISDYLLEPTQEAVLNMIQESPALHTLLLDYFEGGVEACRICGFLLQCIDQTRANYRIIQRVLKLTTANYTKEQCLFICAQFTSFVGLENPLSGSNPMQFQQIHDLYGQMLDQLTCTHRKIMKRAKLNGLFKNTLGTSLVIACATLAIVALVLTTHAFIGLLVMPVAMCSSTPFVKWRFELLHQLGGKPLTRLGAQLDAAAKGAFILNRDFDTMSRLVMRLRDEIEHSKVVMSICLRNGKIHLIEEAVKELRSSEASFLEQLEELEEHVYLCFLTINKARRLVIQEMEEHQ
ncbi:hypothetical protein AAC387_Pa11g1190 [Persea americana]